MVQKSNKSFLASHKETSYFATMKTHTSRSGNVAVEVVVGIVAVVGVVLGIAAIKSGNSVSQSMDELNTRLNNIDSVVGGIGQLESEVRTVKSSYALLGQDVQVIKDQLAKKPEPVPATPAKVAGAKKDAASDAPAGPGTFYTVKSHDSLGKIAKQYGTTSAAIMKLNPGLKAGNLKVGKKVRVK